MNTGYNTGTYFFFPFFIFLLSITYQFFLKKKCDKYDFINFYQVIYCFIIPI